MNQNTAANILTGILLALASSGAMAQSALQQLGSEAEIDPATLMSQIQAVRAANAGPTPVVGLPQHARDIFANCSILDAKSILPWNVSQAAIMVQTCLNHAYPADGHYQVRAQSARFGSEVIGIKITVSGRILIDDSVLLDLNSSLNQRNGKLLGFATSLENKAALPL